MLLDRPIPKALCDSHVGLKAKRSGRATVLGTDRTSTPAAAQDPLRKEGVRHKSEWAGNGSFGTARKQW
jgi:hypothetical protein